jgi:hypothetical protein
MDVLYIVYGVTFEYGRHIVDTESIRVFTYPLLANTYAADLHFKSGKDYHLVVTKPIEVDDGKIPD